MNTSKRPLAYAICLAATLILTSSAAGGSDKQDVETIVEFENSAEPVKFAQESGEFQIVKLPSNKSLTLTYVKVDGTFHVALRPLGRPDEQLLQTIVIDDLGKPAPLAPMLLKSKAEIITPKSQNKAIFGTIANFQIQNLDGIGKLQVYINTSSALEDYANGDSTVLCFDVPALLQLNNGAVFSIIVKSPPNAWCSESRPPIPERICDTNILHNFPVISDRRIYFQACGYVFAIPFSLQVEDLSKSYFLRPEAVIRSGFEEYARRAAELGHFPDSGKLAAIKATIIREFWKAKPCTRILGHGVC